MEVKGYFHGSNFGRNVYFHVSKQLLPWNIFYFQGNSMDRPWKTGGVPGIRGAGGPPVARAEG